MVLVEGDSDYIVLPHLARVINPAWDSGQLPVRFARIGGKGNIRRYKQFFSRFQARVLIVTDLDFLLGTEFGQIEPSKAVRTERDNLIATLDEIIDRDSGVQELNAERVKDAHERGDLRALWKKARELKEKYKTGGASLDDVTKAVDEFFAWEKYWVRRDTLRQCFDDQFLAKKRDLLDKLREQGVCVLEKGSIEEYYPTGVTGENKPAKAQSFCNTVITRDQALTLCNSGYKGPDGAATSEFEAMFQTIFMA